jgi:hypothetical protein
MNHSRNVKHVLFLFLVLIISTFPLHPGSKAVLVSNNLAEFNAVQGKLKLTLVRV